MRMEELNSCLKDFYVSCRKKDSETSIMAIRATIDRFLRVEHNTEPFSIVGIQRLVKLILSLIPSLKIFAKLGKLVGYFIKIYH